MTKTELITRRRLLSGMSVTGMITIAGCSDGDGSQDDIKDSDGDGVIDSEDYAPQDPEVQERSDIQSTETETETESYDPDDYYGLPKCDGSRPIQLIDVQEGEGIIRNMTTDDLLVAVDHEGSSNNTGSSNGSYCGAHIVGGGEQTAYETYGYNTPDRVYIAAIEDTSRNRDSICSQSGMTAGDGGDGCVDPDTFRG